MLYGREWRGRAGNTGDNTIAKKENEFYTNRGINGTINQNNPRLLTIPEIKDNIEIAKTNHEGRKIAHFELLAKGASNAEVRSAETDVKNAERIVENLYNLLTNALGLGPNGYWENSNKPDAQNSPGQVAKSINLSNSDIPSSMKTGVSNLSEMKEAQAQNSPGQETMKPTNLSQVKSGQPKRVDQIDAWVINPEGYRPPDAIMSNGVTPDTTTPGSTTPDTTAPDMDTTASPTTRSGGGNGSPSFSANNDEWMYVGVNDDELQTDRSSSESSDDIPSSMKTGIIREKIPSSMKTGIIRDRAPSSMKTGVSNLGEMNVIYKEVEGMTESEKWVFAKSQKGVKYFENLESLRFVLTPEEILRYKQVLYGTDNPYEITEQGIEIKFEVSKTPELLEAEKAVHLYEELFTTVALETNVANDPSLIEENLLYMKQTASPFFDVSETESQTEDPYQRALILLSEIRDQTGCYTYQEALDNLDREQKNFEEYKITEETKAEATARIEDELQKDPDHYEWVGSDLDIQNQIEQFQIGIDSLRIQYSKVWSDLKKAPLKEQGEYWKILDKLSAEMNAMETLSSEANIALDYDNDIEDLGATQLIFRGLDMYYNQSIALSCEDFNKALDLWKEGKPSTLELIVDYVYGNEKDLDDIEDLDVLKEDYCYYNWQWQNGTPAKSVLDIQEPGVNEIIKPYVSKAIDYTKTDTGFIIKLPTNLCFAMDYAKSMESYYDQKGKVTDYTTTAGSAMFSQVPIVGEVGSYGISVIGGLLSEHYGVEEEKLDDAIALYGALHYDGARWEDFITLEYIDKDRDYIIWK